MQDRFSGRSAGFDGPAERGFAVTPDDGDDLPEATRGLYVGTGGALALVLISGDELGLVNVPDGALLPLRVRRVKATGTTADDIVGLA